MVHLALPHSPKLSLAFPCLPSLSLFCCLVPKFLKSDRASRSLAKTGFLGPGGWRIPPGCFFAVFFDAFFDFVFSSIFGRFSMDLGMVLGGFGEVFGSF